MQLKLNVWFWLLATLLMPACPLIAQDDAAADPLQEIASDMNSAATHLGKLRTGEPTQTAQQNAVKKIDLLIVELEKQRDAARGGSVNPNSTRPATDSVIRSGPGGMGKLHAERREGKQWAQLPEKERERILQSLNEGFPSYYQVILERYFARLADEKPLAETIAADEPPKPAASPKDSSSDQAAPAKDQP